LAVEAGERGFDPLSGPHARLFEGVRRAVCRCEAFFAVRLDLDPLLDVFKALHVLKSVTAHHGSRHVFNRFPRLEERLLVLHRVACYPRLDLLTQPLQLLDLFLQLRLVLLLLHRRRRSPHLLVNVLKDLAPLLHLLQRRVDLSCARKARRDVRIFFRQPSTGN
jgi:hypothetical protein